MEVTRRNALTSAGGALLASAAGALALPALADEGKNRGDTLYGHGMVWNRDLPGEAGQVKLSFDMRVSAETGKGFGTAEDPVHPNWNIHFAINSARQEKGRKGEARYIMVGAVTEAINPAFVGLPVYIVAETVGDMTAVGIGLGDDLTFIGAGLVVIAIIAILMPLLLPAVQKVRG